MITLYQFPSYFGLPNISPFCMKVETYLRLAKLQYEVKSVMNPAKSPKGKLPFIKDGDKAVADSNHIVEYLKEQYGDPLGQDLNRTDRALHYAITRLLEDHLYFVVLYQRWITPEGAAILKDAFLGSVPRIMRGFVFGRIQKSMKQSVYLQGTGRHSEAEIEQLGIDDVNAVATLLGDKKFFGGESPREVDCVAHAFLANIITYPLDSLLSQHARGISTLTAYAERMTTLAYPELAGSN